MKMSFLPEAGGVRRFFFFVVVVVFLFNSSSCRVTAMLMEVCLLFMCALNDSSTQRGTL